MKYSMEWVGAESPEDPSGTAIFGARGETFVFPLPRFEYAHHLRELLDIAGEHDERHALNLPRRRLLNEVLRIEAELDSMGDET